MGIKVLEIPLDEEAIDISKVDEYFSDEQAETPSLFSQEDDVDLLVQGAMALEQIREGIVLQGIDRDCAKQVFAQIHQMQNGSAALESFSLYRRVGGNDLFTAHKSIDGLSVALESIKDTIANAFKRIIERVKEVYRTFIAWLKSKFSSAKPEDLKPSETAKKTASNPKLAAIAKFLDSLGDSPHEAADEVARMISGAPESFRAGLVTEFEALGARLQKFFEKLSSNRSFARIAAGEVSIKELLKQEADDIINGAIKEASDAAQAVLLSRNAQQLQAAVERVIEATAKLQEIGDSTFDTKEDGYEGASEQGVTLSKIVGNVKDAVNTLESANMSKTITELTARLSDIMRSAEQTSKQEIEEMIPEDADEQLRAKAVSSVIALYGKLAGMGQAIARMWALRVTSLRSINTVLETIDEHLQSLQRGISRLARSLEKEQQDALTKALAVHGLIIEI